jgi:hypothetical protein
VITPIKVSFDTSVWHTLTHITSIPNHSNPITSLIQDTIFLNTLHTCLTPSQLNPWPILKYSIHKWVIQCITNTYPILCVTYTNFSKCYHTLFISVLLHYSILRWIYPHEPSLNSIFVYANHKIFIITMYLGGSFFQSLNLPSKLSIPIL